MYWRGKLIVDISREFLDTNGDVKKQTAEINKPEGLENYFSGIEGNCIKTSSNNCSKIERWKKTISGLNCCSQKGLVERFDSTIGAGTVLMPFGGKYGLTPAERNGSKNTNTFRIHKHRNNNDIWI